MNLFSSKLRKLASKCNDIAYKLSEDLQNNRIITSSSRIFCIFDSGIDYTLFTDVNIFADKINIYRKRYEVYL